MIDAIVFQRNYKPSFLIRTYDMIISYELLHNTQE